MQPEPTQSPGSAKKGPRVSKPSTQASVDELQGRIQHFRRLVRETADHVVLAMEAALLRLCEEAQTIDSAKRRRQFCQEAVRRLSDLKIKPNKGRLRDLRRIDALLAELANELADLR